MSEFYQPGQHPDADQLSAFAEDALPAHEREQTLAHLAGCANCRTIVSLALPPMEDVPQLQPVVARRPWFYGWNVAWLAGAGLAALIVLTVHIRNSGHEERNAATPTQTAEVHPQAAPPVAPVAPAVTSSAPPPALRTPRAVTNSLPSGSVENPKKTVDGATINNGVITNLPIQGRMYLEQPQQQQMSQQQMQQQQSAVMHGSIGGASAGMAAGTGVARNDQQYFRQHSPASEANANAAATVITAAPVAAPPVLSAQAPQAPAPPPAPAKAAAQTNDALAADAAADVETTNASVSPMLGSAGSANVRRLPSHLVIASMITRGSDMLALDTAGTLFLSTDGGRHWKAVAGPWPGHAVKVALVSLPTPAIKEPRGSLSYDNDNGSTLSVLDLKAVRTPAVTGVVTDPAGAIIPGASIKISDTRTGGMVATVADRSGRYAAGGLAPGAYQIEASATGFESWRGTVTVVAAQQSVANIRLTVGSISETVEVSAGSPIVSDTVKKKALKTAKTAPVSEPSAVFEVTTDGGDIWTSVDGKNWKRK